MKKCVVCEKYKASICENYEKVPPANFASKCEYYDGPEDTQQKTACEACSRHFDDDIGEHCLKLNNPEYELNFVKMKDGHECPLGRF
jgi:hypothetical protein